MKKIIATLALAALCGCSSEPTKPATSQPAQPKAPETITGSGAFFKCYTAARGWAGDVQGFRAESVPTKTHDGKATEWRISFASPLQRLARSYTWSSGDISHSSDDSYSPGNSSTMVFNFQALKTDTDKAFAVAQQHGGDKVIEKDPDTPVFYVLEWNHLKGQLIWHVIYGTDADSAKLRVAVNATTGSFLQVEK